MNQPWGPVVSRRKALSLGVAGAAALGLGAAGCSSGSTERRVGGSTTSTTSRLVDEGRPKRGGALKIGLIGGGALDTLDPHSLISGVDVLRTYCLYDSLARVTPDRKIELALAEELLPAKDGASWVIRLRDGITFHDGRPVKAKDVIASLRRIIDPKAPKNGAVGFADVRAAGLRAVDDRTVRVTLARPNFLFADWCAEYTNAIVPEDFDPKSPVGTGPFKASSFTAGERSVFTRFDSYWRGGLPYLDEVTIVEFDDDTAVVNAALSGAVDVVYGAPPSQLATLRAGTGLVTTIRAAGSFVPLTMRVDTKPFDDVRVRQAMRLLVDRKQLVEQVLSGEGKIANDLYSPFDPCFAKDLAQRQQDVGQARSLLRRAGQADLRLELVTSPLVSGVVESAQVVQQQAKAAGVKISIKQLEPIQFFTQAYLKSSFSQDIWDERLFVSQTIASFTVGSPFNATHWDDPEFSALLARARREADRGKRCELESDLQRILHDRGSYVVWGFPNDVTVSRAKVKGIASRPTPVPPTELWVA